VTDAPYRKKLVETALPLEAINAACKADKDRKTGTIRNLHKWFAPMPVPALRALIFASLVDDPGDDKERARLLELIEKLVSSVVSNPDSEILDAAKKAIADSVGELPTILDPFCGGGSTLVEAQRLGLPSRGSDLNPIPVLISKALTELPPAVVDRPPLHVAGGQDQGLFEVLTSRDLSGFLSDVEHYAKRVRDEAWARIGTLYPLAPNGDPIIAWWWARTVESPDPRFQGAHVPLVSNWWLSKKRGANAYVQPVVNTNVKTIEFTIETEGSPIRTQKETCLFSGSPLTFPYVRDQGMQGKLGIAMLAMVSHGGNGRKYYPSTETQMRAAHSASPTTLESLALPEKAMGFRVQGYGMKTWGDLFSARQKVALETFADLISKVPKWVEADGGDEGQARAIATTLGLSLGKMAQASSSLVRWRIDARNGAGQAEAAFGRHDLAMTWDFAETNPFGGSRGDWMQMVETSCRAYGCVEAHGPASIVAQGDARRAGEGLDGQCLVLTDPPYFSAIGYANLSDYFYPWIRLALRNVYPELFATLATPKGGELIAEPARHESKELAKDYFISGFTETFTSLRQASRPDLPLLIVYAYKEQEADDEGQVSSGWEAMLEAVIRSGLSIVGTWPVHGTGAARMRGLGSNALATYVVLVCRPRPSTSVRVSRRDLVASLRAEFGPAIEVLQSAAVAPVDLAQAVIGPGMSVFTRYQAVLEPDGSPMTVRSALLLINSVLAEVLDEQEGEFDADTRWAITWFEQFRYSEAPSGEADSLARAKVTSIDGLERAGVIVTRGGTCRLVRRDELSEEYDPVKDTRATVWESVQHLVKQLLDGGEERAASLLARLSNAEAARDLAYRLYSICDRKGWAEEGGAYNVLVASWPEIARLAQQLQTQQRFGSGQLPGLG
jgi:putative DNA methylase